MGKLNVILIVLVSFLIAACSPNSFTTSSSEKVTEDNGAQTDPALPDANSDAVTRLKDQVIEYRARYVLADAFTKLVDNRGNLYSALYGVRNFRAVLHGVYYRGGANNSYNTVDGVRSNENPLPPSGMQNLCEQGFKESIYLYTTNYATSPKTASCVTTKNENNTMNYVQISALTYSNNEKFIQKVYQVIKGERPGPIYGHCWNGWHASGYVSALLLKQFCNYSDTDAVDYWKRNTDNNWENYPALMKKISDFKTYSKYKISAIEAALICPFQSGKEL